MEQIVIPNIPAEYAAVLYTLIGLLSAWLVTPVTAIIKKLGGTSGVTTVTVSAVLSLLVSLGFALATAAAQGEGVNWLGVLIGAVVAFLKANGDHIARSQIAQKAATPAPATVGEIMPPPEVMRSGLEEIR